jgi:hypothetical protein
MTLPKVKAILDEAAGIVNGPRRDDYGHPKRSFERIATFWQIHLEKKLQPGATITARDVADMMIGLKLAREAESPKHDSILDIIGYAALAEEVYDPPVVFTMSVPPMPTVEQAAAAASEMARQLRRA